MMRAGSMPPSRCASIRPITVWAEASIWSLSMARAGLMARMSYQLGMDQPPLMVTGRVGAWGSTKRVLGSCCCSILATGSKS